MSDVSLLGTGLLGAPIALRLASTGLEVTVWNRTASKAEALGEAGLAVSSSAAEALRASPVAILMLADGPAIRQVLLAPEARASLEGKTVVQMGTIGPDESRAFAAEVAGAGGEWIEAPVLGSIPQADSGTLQVMVGGTPEQLERLEPLLSRLGREVRLVGEVGKAAALKLALNQLIGSLTAAFATSLAFARAEGVPPGLFMEVLRPSALYAPTFDKKLGRMLDGEYSNPTFPLRLLRKDLDLFVRAATVAGLAPRITEAVLEVVDAAAERGFADADYAALAEGVPGSLPKGKPAAG
jgi:3-hydroxyisobutyrate dehydrogenase-like beta-hydroxyacid dehydrogenase